MDNTIGGGPGGGATIALKIRVSHTVSSYKNIAVTIIQ